VRNGNVNWITDKTGRASFYATHFDGITLLVLNTNFSIGGVYDTASVNSQFDLIQTVCDTITASSHLILLSHHVVWKDVDGITNTDYIANDDLSELWFNFSPDLKYVDGVYPKLQEVSNKGIKVMHIAGDLGQKGSTYRALTSDNIQFIGSGITANTSYNEQYPTAGQADMFLEFHHNIKNQTISWNWVVLN